MEQLGACSLYSHYHYLGIGHTEVFADSCYCHLDNLGTAAADNSPRHYPVPRGRCYKDLDNSMAVTYKKSL
jgi:hypothetical protein